MCKWRTENVKLLLEELLRALHIQHSHIHILNSRFTSREFAPERGSREGRGRRTKTPPLQNSTRQDPKAASLMCELFLHIYPTSDSG
ncbi:hypothetical protein WR25_00634 [Diploscapter pachys]|uniref:Uncharacterized protein n=1 Tax=Diploscapter pachys TaxID=2018661 RepID=A0A2A2L7H4_9BILA|nr:hypothetical protein WR25_00634 [Diploscapter pachys]